jgi:hypothetical protein
MDKQNGGNIFYQGIINLGLPLGLSYIAANNTNSEKDLDLINKPIISSEPDNISSQKGGFGSNILLESTLAIVPIGLISLTDSSPYVKEKINEEDSQLSINSIKTSDSKSNLSDNNSVKTSDSKSNLSDNNSVKTSDTKSNLSDNSVKTSNTKYEKFDQNNTKNIKPQMNNFKQNNFEIDSNIESDNKNYDLKKKISRSRSRSRSRSKNRSKSRRKRLRGGDKNDENVNIDENNNNIDKNDMKDMLEEYQKGGEELQKLQKEIKEKELSDFEKKWYDAGLT